MSGKMLEEIERRLNAKTIHDLRQVARAVGVPRPADGKKDRVIDFIIQIASGKCDPAKPAVRGAHPKSAEYDRQLVSDIFRCREICLSANGDAESDKSEISVSSGVEFDPLDFTATGILEKNNGRWFMRVNGCRENFISDIFVNEYFINAFKLREGDCVSGKCKRSSLDELAGLASVHSVNGVPPDMLSGRLNFESLTPVYPDKRLKIARDQQDITGRIIDLFSPVGAGQRAIISAPHGTGKTAVLKDVARGLQYNNSELKLIILLVDARPEEAADFTRSFPEADVFTSPFDAGANGHVHTARLALEYAKRQAEQCKHTVLVLDDLTRLTRAFNACGKSVSAALDSSALDSAKKFLAAAKNTEEDASLTIISALSKGVGDPLDEAIYSGLKDLCNMNISLSLSLARSRVYPPIDIAETCAYGDEKLLSSNEIKAAVKLRSESTEKIFAHFAKTENNEDLCKKLLG